MQLRLAEIVPFPWRHYQLLEFHLYTDVVLEKDTFLVIEAGLLHADSGTDLFFYGTHQLLGEYKLATCVWLYQYYGNQNIKKSIYNRTISDTNSKMWHLKYQILYQYTHTYLLQLYTTYWHRHKRQSNLHMFQSYFRFPHSHHSRKEHNALHRQRSRTSATHNWHMVQALYAHGTDLHI